jgi:hypothetical protein
MKSIFKKKTPGVGLFSSFEGTDHSERLQRTFNEVQTFKRQLLKAEAALRVFAKATEEVLKTTDDSLSAFPRAWRQADAAPNTAQLAESDVTKAAPTSKQLGAHPSQDIAMDMDTKLQDEVYTPIERWHKQYQQMKTRIGEVESMRQEYDVSRKEVADARNAQLKHVRKTDGKNDPALDTAEASANKVLAARREAYLSHEEEVHAELVALAADAQAMLVPVRRALRLEAEALLAAEEQLGTLEQQMPVVSRGPDGRLLLPMDFEDNAAASPVASPTVAGATAAAPGVAQSRGAVSGPAATGTAAPAGAVAAGGPAGTVPKKPTGYGSTFSYWDEAGNAIAPPQGARTEAPPTAQMANTTLEQPGQLRDSHADLPNAPTHPVEHRQEANAARQQMPAV